MSGFQQYAVVLGFRGLALILNGATMIAIIASKRLRRTQNVFAFNIALADFVSNFLNVVKLLQAYLEGKFVTELYRVGQAADICGICSTLAVALHRFIIIRYDPFNKRNLVTGPRCIGVCIILWILSLAITFIVHLFHVDIRRTFPGLISPTVILSAHFICAVCYAVVYSTLARAARKAGLSGQMLAQRVKQNKKVLMTFALVVGTNVVCWTPHCAYFLIGYARPDWIIVVVNGITDLASWYKILDILSRCLTGLNGIVNPIIYWARIRDFRLLLTDICSCNRGNADGSVSSNENNKHSDDSSLQKISTVASIDGDMSGKPSTSTLPV